jgi:hypothetical protein
MIGVIVGGAVLFFLLCWGLIILCGVFKNDAIEKEITNWSAGDSGNIEVFVKNQENPMKGSTL